MGGVGQVSRCGDIAAERMSTRRNGCLRFRENMGSVGMVTRRRDARTRRERIARRWQCPLDTSGKDIADSQPGVLFYSTTGYGSENAGGRRRSFSPGGVSAREVDSWGDFSAEKGSAE